LWSLNYAALFVSIGLFLVAKHDSGRGSSIRPYCLGIVLFAAYISRPSTAFFIAIVLVYLAVKDRQALLRAGGLALGLLLIFLLFSYATYGSWMTSYYSAESWLQPTGYLQALYGVILSPSRGLLIYSPFLLLLLGGILGYARRQRPLLFWLLLIWVTCHVLAVAATPMWWGGYSYGPRLLTDAMPGFVLMTAILWGHYSPQLTRTKYRGIMVGYVIFGMAAILINSYVGLFNIKNPLWNAYPPIEEYPEYIFDWRYPQFLVTSNSFHSRRLTHYRRELAMDVNMLEPYEIGHSLSAFDDPNRAVFVGWWMADDHTNWTEVQKTSILFVPEEVPQDELHLELEASAYGEQVAELSLNDHVLGSFAFSGEQTTYTIAFRSEWLVEDELNELAFVLPRARNPRPDDLLTLGLRYAPHRLGLSNVTVRFN
jgi:hypothetical protein